jgi:hypothetical protein
MKDFYVLKLLDRLKPLFVTLGVDYHKMRRILQIKLIMDGRRVPTVTGNSGKNKSDSEDDGNKFLKSLWFYGFMGLIMIPFVILGDNYIFQMSFVFGILMFMIMTSLISDFSSVLLDIRDKNIIFSKPVESRTLSFAKAIHVFIYMFFLTIALAGPALVAALIRHGLVFFTIFLVQLILIDLFIVVITALLYLLILKFFDGEKLKDIINYVQIGLSITITLGYQLVGRLFSISELKVAFEPKWWQYFIVPVWFGAPFEVIMKGAYSLTFILFSTLAVLVPIISIILYIKLMPSFERNLQKLNNNVDTKASKGSSGLTNWMLNIICSGREEKIFFGFAVNMLRNERDFKLKVYPSLGFAMIFPFIFIFNSLRDGGLQSLASGKSYLNIYFCALFLPTVVLMMKYSGKHEGSWIYKVLPTKNSAPIFKGVLKAFIVKLLVPLYVVEGIVFTAIFGTRILPDLILVFLTMLLFTVLCFAVVKKALPFSQPFEAAQQGDGMVFLPLMLLLGLLAAIHFASTMYAWGIYIYMLVLVLANVVAWKKAFNISIENF